MKLEIKHPWVLMRAFILVPNDIKVWLSRKQVFTLADVRQFYPAVDLEAGMSTRLIRFVLIIMDEILLSTVHRPRWTFTGSGLARMHSMLQSKMKCRHGFRL